MAAKLAERKVPLQPIKPNEAKLKDISSLLQVLNRVGPASLSVRAQRTFFSRFCPHMLSRATLCGQPL
jgi:hypothetical protein